jgi:hypothetical protein
MRRLAPVGNGWQLRNGRHVMRLRFMGRHSSPGNSPTVWDTDAGQYVIQGFELDPDTLAQVGDIPPGELVIRVPKDLMRYLPEARHDVEDDLEGAASAARRPRTR